MKLYWQSLLMVMRKFILRRSTGEVLRNFAEAMGIVYIKAAQIIAMQNIGHVFTEHDRVMLTNICDHCNPIPYAEIEARLREVYGEQFVEHFQKIDETPLGSASISQVHRAVLQDGRVVAVKVKRRDITRRIEHDARQIKRLIRRFGRFAKFRNFLGSDQALSLYIDWIQEETDFVHERQNLEHYREFAESVNGRFDQTSEIKVPDVYSELCTEDVLVMEYISEPTVNQLELTLENKQRITGALNSYLSLSFYALLNGLPVVFHGDPHSGNLYLDRAGNLGFLDMGLIFEFSTDEAELIRRLFLNAYAGKADVILNDLITRSKYTKYDEAQLLADIRTEAARFHEIPVTQFFVEMINVFTKYNIAPPIVLFKTAKAFMALFGINNFIENYTDTKTLLAMQVREYYCRRTADDFCRVAHSGLNLLPNFLATTLKRGPIASFAEQLGVLENLNHELSQTCQHCREALDYWRAG